MLGKTIGGALSATVLVTVLSTVMSWPAFAATSAETPSKSPCAGLTIELSANEHTQWSAAIARHIYTTAVDLQQVWGVGPWRLVKVMADLQQPELMIYPDIPTNSGFLMGWTGFAGRDQLARLETNAIKSATDVPKELASCFAWVATEPR